MTKRDVRSAILSRLAVKPDDIIWDVGAGTGSVSVELALAARKGHVYAVECGDEGCLLTDRNRRAFGAWNLSVIQGMAPDILNELPSPDAVFIGGTKGRMKEIIELISAKNENARICIAAIALETLTSAVEALTSQGYAADVTQIAVSNTKNTGRLHMLTANNPVFLITGRRE